MMTDREPYNLRKRPSRVRTLFGKPLTLKNSWSIRQMKTLYHTLIGHKASRRIPKFKLAQSIRELVAARKCYKWYIQHKFRKTMKAREAKECSNSECPITLEPVDSTTMFRRLTSNGVCIAFDPTALISYLLTQDHFQCPMTREPLTADDGLVLQHLVEQQNIDTQGVNMYIASMSERERRKFRIRMTRQKAFDQLYTLIQSQTIGIFAMVDCSFIDIVIINYKVFCNTLYNFILMGTIFKTQTIAIIDRFITLLDTLECVFESETVFRTIQMFFTQCRTNVIDFSNEQITQNRIVDLVVVDDPEDSNINNIFLEVR